MSTECTKYTALQENLLGGTISANDRKFLEQHARSCADCTVFLETHARLSELSGQIPMPSESEFEKSQQQVHEKVEADKTPDKVIVFNIPHKYLYRTIAAAAIFIAGFFIGHFSQPGGSAGLTGMLVKQLNHFASTNTEITDIKNAPYRFSGVRFREVDDKQIELNFDVTTHLNMVRKKDDPLVKDVLASSILDPENMGARLKAISVAPRIMNPKIKQALTYSIQNETELPIRLKAAAILKTYHNDPELRILFSRLLTEDEPVQLRLIALDYLATGTPGSGDSLGSVVDELQNNNATPIKVKANEILNRPN